MIRYWAQNSAIVIHIAIRDIQRVAIFIRAWDWKVWEEGEGGGLDGNETLVFKRFRLFWSRFDSSDCESPSKCFLLSNFDIPAY